MVSTSFPGPILGLPRSWNTGLAWLVRETAHSPCSVVGRSIAVLAQDADCGLMFETNCLKLTPNIRSICKPICKAFANQAANAHNVRCFDRFTQRTTRFLFEPNENFWRNFERKEIRTILPDGSLETQSWLRRGKGLCTFTQAADLDRGRDVKVEAPYTFLRDDHTKAVVWSRVD